MSVFRSHTVDRISRPVRLLAIVALLAQQFAAGVGGQPAFAAESHTPVLAAQPVAATKTARLATDRNGNGLVDPGDTIRYTVAVSNTSAADLAGVQVDDAIDPNTSLVPDSIRTTPLAFNQTLATAEDTAHALTLTGSDADGQTLVFQITVPPSHGSLSGTAPDLLYTPAANYNGADSFSFSTCDTGTPTSCDSATVSLTVTPVNDNPTAGDDAVTVPEGSTNTQIDVLANDSAAPDTAETLTIIAVGMASKGTVSIGTGGSNLVYTPNPGANGADSFTYTIDDGNGGSATATVTVTISSVNDPPSFTKGPDQTVAEDAGAQTVSPWATAIAAGPADEVGQTLAFEVTGNTNPALFSTAPAITPAGDLTYTPAADASGSAQITVVLKDNGGTANGGVDTSAPQRFTITVTPVNDAPVVDQAAFAVDENSPVGTTIGTVTYSDVDTGQNHSFAITGGNTGGAFAIDTTGKITVANSAALDFETNPSFNLTVTVTDDGAPAQSGSATITVAVNGQNEAPVPTAATFTLDENSPNATDVGTVTYTDPDAGQTHTFAITGGNTGGAFAIDNAGKITVANAAALDYETTPSFNLTVSVTDDGTPVLSGSATVTINLNNLNEAPIADDGTFAIDENSPNGTSVGSVTYSDPDTGQTYSFSITAGNTNGAFAIDNTGKITVANAAALDYETTPSFNLTVRVADNGTPVLADTATVAISLNDLNEAPTAGIDNYTVTGNTQLRVAGASGSAVAFTTDATNPLANDADPDNNPAFANLRAVAASGTSSKGGSYAIASDGSFVYTPPAGVSADAANPDTFTYQLTDGTNTVNGTVRIVITNMVWYVQNNTATAGAGGTSTDPFDTLAEAQTASKTGEIIYVLFGDGTSTKQNVGITLKTGQKLWGEGIDLVVGGNTLLAGNAARRPLLDNAGGNAVTAVPDTDIQGLNLAGGTNAIDLTTTASAGGSLTVKNNTVRSAGQEGIDINAGGSGTLLLDVQNNAITATGNGFDAVATAGSLNIAFAANTSTSGATGVSIAGSGGAVTITNFAGNTVSGNTAGTGVSITSATFDAVPGGSFNQVSGGVTVIGATGNGVGGSGLVMSTVSGDLGFADLDIVADGGAGLRLTGTGAFTGASGTRVSVGANVGTVAAIGGPAVDATTATLDTQFSTIRSSNSTTTGLALTTVGGAFSAGTGSTITNATGTDVVISGGNANVTYGGTISDNSGQLASVANTSGGTKAFTGAITDNASGGGTGISLLNNTGATITFSGGLALTTGANPAFSATGGGTIGVSGAANTLQTTTGVALQVQNTTIDAVGLTFASISAGTAASGPTNGILLNNTGTFGGLTVTGTGSTGSGGTIQKASGDGIALTNTRGIALSSMNISNNGDATNESGIRMNNVFGTNTINGSTVSGSSEDNIYLRNDSGTLNGLTIQGPNCSIVNNNSTIGNSGVNVMAVGTANMTVSINGCQFAGNRTDAIHPDAADTSVLNVTIANNTIGAGAPNQGNIGIEVTASASAQVTYDITNNTVGVTGGPLLNTGINVFSGNSSVVSGKINGNTVVNAGASLSGIGIRVFQSGASTLRANVSANTVSNVGQDYGLLAEGSGDTTSVGKLDVAVTNNNVSVLSTPPPGALNPIRVQSRNTNTVCARVSGNTTSAGGTGFVGLFLRQANTATFKLEGLATGTQTAATTKTYVTSQNPGAASVDTTAATNFVGVAANSCNIPAPLLAAGGQNVSKQTVTLSQATLAPIVAKAIEQWVAIGLRSSEVAQLRATTVTIGDLPNGYLGLANAGAIEIDGDAAGWGWSIGDAPKINQIDLLTVVMHEFGHILGRDDEATATANGALMSDTLAPGTRRMPEAPAGTELQQATPQASSFPLQIGILPAGKRVIITFDVVIADPLAAGVSQISNQATVRGDTFGPLGSDDPATAAANDPTVVLLNIAMVGSMVFVPIALNPGLPDLVVDTIQANRTTITVVIRNQGAASVVDPFWVDAYINPNPAPTAVNQIWPIVSKAGLVWGITTAALPLQPGESLTLTLGGSYYRPDLSVVPKTIAAGTPIYAQVDSANAGVADGAVLETHEKFGGPYNNIRGPVLATVSIAPQATAPGNSRTSASASLPERPGR